MDNTKHRRLQELDRSDFEIVDGEPDIRGWDVKYGNGKKLGEVEELIVDASEKKCRYMVVELDELEFHHKNKKVLIPIGMAELHKSDDDVILYEITEEQLRTLPAYDKDRLDDNTERAICNVLGKQNDDSQSAALSPDFYHHDYFNDDNLYKQRLHEAKTKEKSEYEKGLKLWEKRSEGGIIPGKEAGRGSSRSKSKMDMPEATRIEMVRNRRQAYEQRRNGGLGRDHYPGGDRGSIEDRIRDEGLR